MSEPDLRALLLLAQQRLPGNEARLEAELLLMHALARPRAWLYAHADEVPVAAVREAFDALLQRRCAGEPIAYLTGEREFWSMKLRVTSDTLIPRADTELLVECALERIPPGSRLRLLDLGTGSGAIALALARERPLCEVVATDASTPALAVARHNACSLNIANVEFVQSDWCASLQGRRFDLIVSNPPYIAADDPHLGGGDLRFEPASALASGHDGLDAIRQIITQARALLGEPAWLLLEHGAGQGPPVRELLRESDYEQISTRRDLEQRERVTLARCNPIQNNDLAR